MVKFITKTSLLCMGISLLTAWSSPGLAAPPTGTNTVSPATGASAAPPTTGAAKPKEKESKPQLDENRRPEVLEVNKIEPELTYREAYLDMREGSAFHKEEHQDFVDQLYLNLRFRRDRDLRNEVVLEPTIRTPRGNPKGLETVIEQAYVDFQLGRLFHATAGRKAEYDGSGFVTNPSDLLNEDRDQFDPLAQKQGKNFTRIGLRKGDFSLSVGYIPQAGQRARTGKLWIQSSAEVGNFDLHLQETIQETDKSTTGFSVSRFFGDVMELHYDGRYQSRQRAAEVQPERKFSVFEAEESSFYHLMGTRLVLTSKRTLILEGIQNQSGLEPIEMEAYHRDLESQSEDSNKPNPPTRLIGRNYGFLAYQDEESISKTMIGFSGLLNAADRSVFGTLTGRYSLSPITSVELSPTFFRGRKYSEFGELPFATAIHLIFRGRF